MAQSHSPERVIRRYPPNGFASVTARQLDPSRTRPSNIIATNSEAFGSRSHSLRQSFPDQHPLPAFE